MANLPSSLSLSASSFGNIPAMSAPQSPSPVGGAAGGGVGGQAAKEKKMLGAEQLVLDLCDPDLRENALLDLSKVPLSLSLRPRNRHLLFGRKNPFPISEKIFGSSELPKEEQRSNRTNRSQFSQNIFFWYGDLVIPAFKLIYTLVVFGYYLEGLSVITERYFAWGNLEGLWPWVACSLFSRLFKIILVLSGC